MHGILEFFVPFNIHFLPKKASLYHVYSLHLFQEEVFGAVGKKIVEGCVAGYNGTIFA